MPRPAGLVVTKGSKSRSRQLRVDPRAVVAISHASRRSPSWRSAHPTVPPVPSSASAAFLSRLRNTWLRARASPRARQTPLGEIGFHSSTRARCGGVAHQLERRLEPAPQVGRRRCRRPGAPRNPAGRRPGAGALEPLGDDARPARSSSPGELVEAELGLAPLELAQLAPRASRGRPARAPRRAWAIARRSVHVGAQRRQRVAREVDRVVDLVRHAGRQLAHRRQPLRLHELDLGLLQLRERALELARSCARAARCARRAPPGAAAARTSERTRASSSRGMERLRHVVVGAELEPLDLHLALGLRGHQHHRDRAASRDRS